MPSWVALLTQAPFGDPEMALNGRVNGNSLVGQPDERFYNACAGRSANVSFETTDYDPATLPGTLALSCLAWPLSVLEDMLLLTLS